MIFTPCHKQPPKSTSNGCIWHNEHKTVKKIVLIWQAEGAKLPQYIMHGAMQRKLDRGAVSTEWPRPALWHKSCSQWVFPLSAVGAFMALIADALDCKSSSNPWDLHGFLHWFCFQQALEQPLLYYLHSH